MNIDTDLTVRNILGLNLRYNYVLEYGFQFENPRVLTRPCPKCQSWNVAGDTDTIVGMVIICKSCGYVPKHGATEWSAAIRAWNSMRAK